MCIHVLIALPNKMPWDPDRLLGSLAFFVSSNVSPDNLPKHLTILSETDNHFSYFSLLSFFKVRLEDCWFDRQTRQTDNVFQSSMYELPGVVSRPIVPFFLLQYIISGLLIIYSLSLIFINIQPKPVISHSRSFLFCYSSWLEFILLPNLWGPTLCLTVAMPSIFLSIPLANGG